MRSALSVGIADKVETESPLLEYTLKIQGVNLKAISDTGCSTMVYISSKVVEQWNIKDVVPLATPFTIQLADKDASKNKLT